MTTSAPSTRLVPPSVAPACDEQPMYSSNFFAPTGDILRIITSQHQKPQINSMGAKLSIYTLDTAIASLRIFTHLRH